MATPITFPDITLALSPTKAVSPQASVPAGYQSAKIAIVSSTPAWNTTVGLGSLSFGIEYSIDGGTTWNLLLANDAAYGSDIPLGQVDRHGNPPTTFGGPWPFIDGKLVRAYGYTTLASLTLVVRITIS